MIQDDEQVARALRGLATRQPESGPVPVALLLHRGRRARRLRTTLRTAAGAGCLALALGAVLVLRPGGTPTLPTPPAGPSTSATPSATATPHPPEGAGPPSDETVLAAWKLALPAGVFSEVRGPGPAASGGVGLSARFDDGTGIGEVSVTVKRKARQATAQADELTCPDPKLAPYDSCRTSTLSDGSVLLVLRTPIYGAGRAGLTQAVVVLSRKDGRLITVKASNAGVDKTQPLTRTTPPLTPDQLTAAASSAVWDPVVAALPALVDGPPSRSEFPGGQIVATATSLLPAGLTPADANTSGYGYANFTVTDGKGPALVEISLSDNRREPNSGPQADWESLPDGTQFYESTMDVGVQRWSIEVRRPDGLWVTVMTYDSDRLKQDRPNRPGPALTTAQLRAIALSPAWKLPG
ncbi:hypothetical protein [Kitasatospora sp. NPDC002040]|uniref:hypothetical protein n=1 Tax=Kitasatospora sp. NPDC002040 TaxID=3154661 RepID=UPI0033196AF9